MHVAVSRNKPKAIGERPWPEKRFILQHKLRVVNIGTGEGARTLVQECFQCCFRTEQLFLLSSEWHYLMCAFDGLLYLHTGGVLNDAGRVWGGKIYIPVPCISEFRPGDELF